MNRKDAKERLALHLERLADYCKPEDTVWPSREFLQSLEDKVELVIAEERNKPLSWRTLRRLDKRIPTLRIVLRVDNLVKRARERLVEAGESALDKLARRGGGQKFLRDVERLRNDLSNAKAIDWEQDQSVLKSISGTGMIKLACGDSPVSSKVICYARTLELLVDDYRREPLRRESRPLLEWLTRIGHPQAKSLLAFNYAAECDIERKEKTLQQERILRAREKNRERTRRHREWYRGTWVYPGDWLRHSHKNPLPAWAKVDPDACCELCGALVGAGDYWYIQRTDNQRARCSNCQSVIWQLDGYEVIYPSGLPCGAWGKPSDWIKHDAARYAESIREVLGDKYIPERIRELLAAEQTNDGYKSRTAKLGCRRPKRPRR